MSSVLAVCAHPDDESFGLGGVLDAFARSGAAVAVLCFTHGEQSTLGALEPEVLRAVRSDELGAAARALGVGAVVLGDHPDGALGCVPLEVLSAEVRAMSARVGADLLLVFDADGVTGHPDHRQATRAALDAGERDDVPVLGWAVGEDVARALNRELGVAFVGRPPVDVAVDLQVDRSTQWRAIGCHASQSSANPVLHRRLALQGDRELLCWLRAPEGRIGAETYPRGYAVPVGPIESGGATVMQQGDGPREEDRKGRGAAAVPEMSAAELAGLIGTQSAPTLVDVREPDEFAGWSIPGAVNIPLGRLERHVDDLVGCDQVVLVCASGARSDQAARQLLAAGLPAANLAGGMLAWASTYDTADVPLDEATIVQVRRRGKGCLSYVVGARGEAFVVDPSADVDRYLGLAAERGWRISRVFDTHLHADHLSGARALAESTGATLHLSAADGYRVRYEPVVDGQWLPLGGATHLGVTVFATPGHTEGSVVLHVGGRAVLTGDTLFVDGVGRPDLADRADEYARHLHRSLHAKVLALPTDALVLPAHYGDGIDVRPGVAVAATLGTLRRDLPPLSMDEEEFVTWATGRVTERPPHYVEIVRVNSGHTRAPLEECRRLELGPNRCAA